MNFPKRMSRFHDTFGFGRLVGEKVVNLRHKTKEAFMNENTIKEALKKGERITLECKKVCYMQFNFE